MLRSGNLPGEVASGFKEWPDNLTYFRNSQSNSHARCVQQVVGPLLLTCFLGVENE